MPGFLGTQAAVDNVKLFGQLWKPLPSFNYLLQVEGVYDLACRRVHSFTKENEYEFIQEGGLNDYVHMRRKQISKPFTFKVERYVGTDFTTDPIELGTDLILPVSLMVFDNPVYSARTVLPIRTYIFTGCTVMAKEFGELNGEQSGLLTETTTFGYREMMKITAPIDAAQMYPDSFKTMKEKKRTKYSREPKNMVSATDDKNPRKAFWNGFEESKKDSTKLHKNVRGLTPNTWEQRYGEEEEKKETVKKTNKLAAKWDGFKDKENPSTKRLRAVKPKKDDTVFASTGKDAALWQGFDAEVAAKQIADYLLDPENTPPPDISYPSTKRLRAVAPAKPDSARAPVVKLQIPETPEIPSPNEAKWDGFAQDPPSTERTRAVKPKKDDSARAQERKLDVPKTPKTPSPNEAKWDGFAQNPPSTARTRAVKPDKADSARAPVVKWPESERKMMAQLLKR